VCRVKCESVAEAKRWLVALALLDSDSYNLHPSSEVEPAGASVNRSCSLVSTSKSSLATGRVVAEADCNNRREVIQNAFLDEFRKERQFEQLLRSSKCTSPTSASSSGTESHLSALVLRGNRAH